MSIIGADAARLAGLQIDMLSKYRAGQLSLDHCERFFNLSPEAREERFGDSKAAKKGAEITPVVKFTLLADLDMIVVPANYKHESAIAAFQKKNRKKFYYWNNDINDENFANPSRILKSADRLHVRIFRQNVGGTTTSEERLAFLKSLPGAVLVGAQGAALVFDQKSAELPRGYWYLSFDEKERLWEDADGYHRVPSVDVLGHGNRCWIAGDFEKTWNGNSSLVSFCDETSEALATAPEP